MLVELTGVSEFAKFTICDHVNIKTTRKQLQIGPTAKTKQTKLWLAIQLPQQPPLFTFFFHLGKTQENRWPFQHILEVTKSEIQYLSIE